MNTSGRRMRSRKSTDSDAGGADDSGQAIAVSIRVRPLNTRELKEGAEEVWLSNNTTIQSTNGASSVFTFDHVFGTEVATSEVYHTMGAHIVKSAMEGINGTIFAYGQTSSGKTYTMSGNDEVPGVIPSAIDDVFQYVSNHPERQWQISVSYLEIYNEVIQDLLNHSGKNLRVRQDLERGIFVKGLTEEAAENAETVIELMRKGEAHRHFSSTQMNHESSRSHTVFKLHIKSWAADSDASEDGKVLRVASLNLVDLAGSERARKTGANKVQLREGGHINTSLLNLGTVIHKLSRGESHIPYRNSKLTRILQPSLGGNSRTAIICNITPADIHESETVSTLNFAASAKRIKNKPIQNELLDDAAKLRKREKEIKKLKATLEQMDGGDLLREKDELAEALAAEQANAAELRAKIESLSHLVVFGGGKLEPESEAAPSTPSKAASSDGGQPGSPRTPSAACASQGLIAKRSRRRETWCPTGDAVAFFSPARAGPGPVSPDAREQEYLRDIAALRAYNAALVEENAALVADLEKHVSFGDTFAAELAAALDENAGLEQSVVAAEDEAAEAQAQINALTLEISAAHEATLEAQTQANEAAAEAVSKLEAAMGEIAGLKKELKSSKADDSAIQKRERSLRKDLDKAKAKAATLEDKLKEVRAQRTAAESEAKAKAKALKDLQKDMDKMQSALTKANEQVTRSSSASKASSQSVAVLEKEVAALRKAASKAEASAAAAAAERDEAVELAGAEKSAASEARRRVAALEAELETAQNSLASATALAQERADKLAAAKEALDSATATATSQARQSSAASLKIASMEQELEASKIAVDEAVKARVEAETAAAAAAAEAAEAAEALAAVEPREEVLRTQVDELQAEIREKRKALSEAKQALEASDAKISAAEASAAQAAAAVVDSSAAEAELEAARKRESELTEKLADLAFEVEELKASLAQAEDVVGTALMTESELKAQVAELEEALATAEATAPAAAPAPAAASAPVEGVAMTDSAAVAAATAKVTELEAELAERDEQLERVVVELQTSMDEAIKAEEENNKLLREVSELKGSLEAKQKAMDAANMSSEETMRLVNELRLEKTQLENQLNDREEELEAKIEELETALAAQPADVAHQHALETALSQAQAEKEALILKLEQMDKRQRDETRSLGNTGRMRRMSMGMDDDALASTLQDEIMQLTSEISKLREENRTKEMEKANESAKLRSTEARVHQLQRANDELVGELQALRTSGESGGAAGDEAGAAGQESTPLKDVTNGPRDGAGEAGKPRMKRLGGGGPLRQRKIGARRVMKEGAKRVSRASTKVQRASKESKFGGGLGAQRGAATLTSQAGVGDAANPECNQQ